MAAALTDYEALVEASTIYKIETFFEWPDYKVAINGVGLQVADKSSPTD